MAIRGADVARLLAKLRPPPSGGMLPYDSSYQIDHEGPPTSARVRWLWIHAVFRKPDMNYYSTMVPYPWAVNDALTMDTLADRFRQDPRDTLVDIAALELGTKEAQRITDAYNTMAAANVGARQWLVPLKPPRAGLKTRKTVKTKGKRDPSKRIH